MKTKNKYINKSTGETKILWETKSQYENHKGDFDIAWEQVSYSTNKLNKENKKNENNN